MPETTDHLVEAVEAVARVIDAQTMGFGDYRTTDVAKATIEAAQPFFAIYYMEAALDAAFSKEERSDG